MATKIIITCTAASGVGPFTLPIPAALLALDNTGGQATGGGGYNAVNQQIANIFKAGYFLDPTGLIAYPASIIASIASQ
jgi:hypothetical protein